MVTLYAIISGAERQVCFTQIKYIDWLIGVYFSSISAILWREQNLFINLDTYTIFRNKTFFLYETTGLLMYK
jgi:hypothetical protein